MTGPTPDTAYEAAARAQIRAAPFWPIDPEALERSVRHLTAERELRAIVDAVWTLAEERRKRHIADTVREVVELATAEISPEWVLLVQDVRDGKYTPPEVGHGADTGNT